MTHLRIAKPDPNFVAHILAITALLLVAFIVFGIGSPARSAEPICMQASAAHH